MCTVRGTYLDLFRVCVRLMISNSGLYFTIGYGGEMRATVENDSQIPDKSMWPGEFLDLVRHSPGEVAIQVLAPSNIETKRCVE